MKTVFVSVVLVVFLFGHELLRAQNVSPKKPTPFTVKTNEGGILVSENGKPVLQYQSQPRSKDGSHRRANYVHPLFDLDGNVLTEDFPSDHLHHRGIFWAWHQVNVGEKAAGDGWMTEDFDWIVTSKKSEITDQIVRITADVQWQSGKIKDQAEQPIPIINEKTTIEIHRESENRRIIDFTIRLLAAQADVTIGGSDDVKGYGGFSARVIQPQDIVFNTASGPMEATKTQMDCGNWVDIVGTFGKNSSPSGLAVMVHPSSSGFPQKWILRSKNKSMQNPVYPGRERVLISSTRPTTLRYRIVLHQTPLTVNDLNSIYQSFEQLK